MSGDGKRDYFTLRTLNTSRALTKLHFAFLSDMPSDSMDGGRGGKRRDVEKS